ncbi:MAG: hypothetical protein DRN95_00560 [Candidatus Hydrothermarchaeota archaeon]|nr:MAG: hypothetical protein DRN95_00560 [Candidatus Hydrothermarchaeota archaeon]
MTTIQVKEDVIKTLARLKKEFNVKSYDEVIRILIKRAKKPKKSYFGSLPKLEQFKREEIDRFD